MKKRKILINAGLELLASDDVIKHVPSKVYERIKKEDANPMFVALAVGYEGESHGKLYDGSLHNKKKLTNWYKQIWPLKAIKELISMMKGKCQTLPVYEAHDIGMRTRNVVGNLVASTKRVINGLTHAVGIAYINNYGTRKRIEDGDFDSCSIEANCIFEKSDGSFRYIVREVKELLGIALCNSEKNPPGFDDAQILAVVTAMADEDDDDDDNGNEKGKRRKERVPMNLTEIKNFIRENNLTPDNLFSIEELTKVPTVVDVFKNEHKQEVDEKDKKIDELEKEIAPLRNKNSTQKVEEMVRGSKLLDDEYKEAVEYLVKTVKVDIEGVEKPQEKIDEAIKAQLALMKDAKFKTKTGEKKDETEEKDEDEEENVSPDHKKEEKKDTRKDMSSPENNPLIPQPKKE